jgi:molybdopterin converting factor small subunit
MERRILQISPKDTIRSVQERFSSWYPYLRLNFFKRARKSHSSQISFSPEVSMAEINNKFVDANYELEENTTVGMLEKSLFEISGLPVQVFRRSGNLWLETRLTDHLTLNQQDNLGREISQESNQTFLPFAQVPYGS